MTTRQYRSLAKYAGTIARELGLGHLDLTLDSSPSGHANDGSESAASFEGTYGRHRGVIRVNPNFDHYTPEEQRVTIIHELLHAHTEAMRELVRNALPPALGQAAFDVFMAAFTQADERFTDALSTGIANKFPLWEG